MNEEIFYKTNNEKLKDIIIKNEPLKEKNIIIHLDDRENYDLYVVFERGKEKIRIPKKDMFEKLKQLFPEFPEPK